MQCKIKHFTNRWTNKTLPTQWEKLAKDHRFYELPLMDQRFLKLFYMQRGHCCLSYAEIEGLFGLSNRHAKRVIKEMDANGLIFKKHQFLGKTKIHARNYITLSKKGTKHLRTLANSYYDRVFNYQKKFPSLPIKVLYSTKRNKICQGGITPPVHTFRELFRSLISPEKFVGLYEKASAGTHLALNRQDPKHVKQVLKYMLNKCRKFKYGFSNFWGFFFHLIKCIREKGKIEDFASHQVRHLEVPEELKKNTGKPVTDDDYSKLIRNRKKNPELSKDCSYRKIDFTFYKLKRSLMCVRFLSKVKPVKNLLGMLTYCMNLPYDEMMDRFMKSNARGSRRAF